MGLWKMQVQGLLGSQALDAAARVPAMPRAGGGLGWWEELSTMLKGAGIPEGVEGTSQRIGNVCRAPLQAHLWGGAVSSMEGALKRSFSFGFGLEVICSAKLFCSASRRRVEKQGREGKAWDDS